MKKRNGLLLTICGAVIMLLSGIFIAIGVIEATLRSEYQQIGMNTPVVILAALVFIAGAAALIIGLRKMKTAKEEL